MSKMYGIFEFKDGSRGPDGKLEFIEWANNTVLLCSAGDYIQYPRVNDNGKEYEKECIYILSILCIVWAFLEAQTVKHLPAM